MATEKETVEFILSALGKDKRFTTRAMFGEYALYANERVVALICDNQLYVKIVPTSAALESVCEKGEPYPGARPHYIVDEAQLLQNDEIPGILIKIAASLPAPKKKVRRSR